MITIPKSRFFTERRAPALPPPASIRALNRQSGDSRATCFNRPPPVKIPSLGLCVKYGGDVTMTEAQTQILIRDLLRDKVPIPEVFGWVEDEKQTFIYMSLVEGDTLATRWGSMNEAERLDICKQLRNMVNAWRTLEQDPADCYIGSIDKRPLLDIFLQDRPQFSGPYLGPDAVQRLQDRCGIEISDPASIKFTHNDICPVNIMITPEPHLKVAAIIDWGQSGWYPSYWEYCKARTIGVLPGRFDPPLREEWPLLQEEWQVKYVPLIIDPVDDETHYHPWFYYVLHWGI